MMRGEARGTSITSRCLSGRSAKGWDAVTRAASRVSIDDYTCKGNLRLTTPSSTGAGLMSNIFDHQQHCCGLPQLLLEHQGVMSAA